MQRSFFVAALAAVCLGAGAVSAAEVVYAKDNIAFTVPDGWEDQKGQFGLYVTADGIGSLIGSKMPFTPTSVEQGSERHAQMFARANTTFRQIGAPTPLKGKNWTARVVTFQGTVNTILEMVGHDGRAYRNFALTVNNEEYARNKEKYWNILRSWRSPAS